MLEKGKNGFSVDESMIWNSGIRVNRYVYIYIYTLRRYKYPRRNVQWISELLLIRLVRELYTVPMFNRSLVSLRACRLSYRNSDTGRWSWS